MERPLPPVFPTDIFHIICSHLPAVLAEQEEREWPFSAFKRMCLVSKDFCSIMQPIIFHDVEKYCPSESLEAFKYTVRVSPELAYHVKRLRLNLEFNGFGMENGLHPLVVMYNILELLAPASGRLQRLDIAVQNLLPWLMPDILQQLTTTAYPSLHALRHFTFTIFSEDSSVFVHLYNEALSLKTLTLAARPNRDFGFSLMHTDLKPHQYLQEIKISAVGQSNVQALLENAAKSVTWLEIKGCIWGDEAELPHLPALRFIKTITQSGSALHDVLLSSTAPTWLGLDTQSSDDVLGALQNHCDKLVGIKVLDLRDDYLDEETFMDCVAFLEQIQIAFKKRLFPSVETIIFDSVVLIAEMIPAFLQILPRSLTTIRIHTKRHHLSLKSLVKSFPSGAFDRFPNLQLVKLVTSIPENVVERLYKMEQDMADPFLQELRTIKLENNVKLDITAIQDGMYT